MQVIEETLRHHPPVLAFPKESEADKELVLSGYLIPTKSRLAVRTDRDFKVQLSLSVMIHIHNTYSYLLTSLIIYQRCLKIHGCLILVVLTRKKDGEYVFFCVLHAVCTQY